MKTAISIWLLMLVVCVRADITTFTYGSVNGPTTLTNPTFYPITNSFFRFPGTPLTTSTFQGITYYGSKFDPANSLGLMQPMKVAFNVTCKEFEVLCYGGYPYCMTYSPPDYSMDTNQIQMANGQGYCWVRVQFNTRTNRNVIFYLSGSFGNQIGGINVESGDTIGLNTLPPRKTLEVLGDSYTEGYNQDQTWCRWLGGYCMTLERMLSNVDVIPSGEGGTGFINNGPSVGETNYAGRFFSNVVSNRPDFLLIQGSVNDTGLMPSNNVYYAAVTNLFALAVSNLPNCKIGSIGVFYYNSPTIYNPAPATSTNYSVLTGLAATNYGLPFVDPIAGGWLNPNNYMYISSDSVHPTSPLYQQYATNLFRFVTNVFNLAAAQGSSGPAASATFVPSVTNGAAPLAVNFTYTGTNGTTFAWVFGDGGGSTAANPQYSYTNSGVYTVSLTVNGNVTQTMPSLITAAGTGLASAGFTTSPTSGAAPLAVNFNYTGTNGTTFAWKFGDGGTSTAENPSYTYNAVGSYPVTLVVNGNVTNTVANAVTATNAGSSGNSLNVANFGAVGDAVQFYVNTTSNSVLVTTTNVMPSSSIGETIEIFQAGLQGYGVLSAGTNGYGNQDLIAVITNVVAGTNIYISTRALNSLQNAFATYGHDNRTNFQNAVNAAGSNTVINIPAGKYLIMGGTNTTCYGYFGVALSKGGITLNGAGTNQTMLLGQGAWTMRPLFGATGLWRAFLFEENPPIQNNTPFVMENMTLDGGVQQGNTPYHGYPANVFDGGGWDGTHDAFLVWSGNNANAYNQMTWTNLVFQHWRGEMVKSIDQSTNGNLYVVNSSFIDGDATAINIYPSINFTNCMFNNLFQVAEYYQAYSTNTCYFQNNVCTNITGNGFALNGGKGSNPPFVLSGNTFFLSGYGNNGIETVPADNVLISNNLFVCQNFANAIVLGCAGYQGTFDNSNIVIVANTVTNPFTFVEIAGGYSANDTQRVESVTVSGNVLRNPQNAVYLLLTYGWTTNIMVCSNDCSQFLQQSVAVNSGNYGAPYSLINTNNSYFTQVAANSQTTNYISYANGSRFIVVQNMTAGTAFALADTNASQIPAGAQILVVNSNSSAASIPVQLSSSQKSGQVMVGAGQTLVASWVNGSWQTGSPPVLAVSPNSMSLGTLLNGTSSTNSIMVQNTGGGTLSGLASVSAPFSILSGGTYSLGANQSQMVTVVFDPTAAGNYSQNVTLTGGGGTNVTVTGLATNLPNPIIQVTSGNMPFGTILSGKSLTNSFTVQNVGGGTLSGTANVGTPFNIVSGGSYNLGSDQSQAVVVSFSPGVAGNYTQSVTLTGGGGTNVTVSGTATNVPVPIIQVSPGSMSFGTILSGKSVTNSFTVQNTGNGILSGTASVGAPFNIISGASYSLATNQSQTVVVVFSPTATNNYTQSVTLTGGGGTNVTVSGSATNAPVPNPAIAVTPRSIAYGVLLNGTSATNSFTVQNTGGGILSGTASVGAPFSILSGASYSLGSNQNQTVTIVFSPTVASNYTQSVTLTGGGGTNVTVSGSATNVPNPIIQVTCGSLSFGTILSGVSATNSFTVQNTGGGILSGTASVGAPFSILSGASYSLGSNQNQTVTIVFSPTVASNYTQSVTLTGGGGTNVTVSGSATNVPNPIIQVTSGSLSYGTILSGVSETNSFTVQNVGNGILSGTASVGSPFSILSGASYNLATNQSQTVKVVFSPVVASNYTQNVTFTGGGGTNMTVSGAATNLPPLIHVTPVSIAFGTIRSGQSVTNSFTVKNTGSGILSGAAIVAAPFWILSGGNYNLATNQSQTVKVVFSPTQQSNYTQNVIFSGGAGASAAVSGGATHTGGVPPTLSVISANVSNLGTNAMVLEIAPGAAVQLSASASAPSGDTLDWQWLNSMNGGIQTVYQLGSGTSPKTSFTNSVSTCGDTFVWTLQVIDTHTGLSAQSQVTVFVELLPPSGIQIQSQ